MVDPKPGDKLPDPTRVEGGEEPSTADAPSRWSAAAAVPPPVPKKSWWSRLRPEVDERTAVPAVDPWAGQDTPVDPIPVAVPIEKTKIDAPHRTAVEPPASAPPPPHASPSPASAPPTRAPQSPASAPPPPHGPQPPASAPPTRAPQPPAPQPPAPQPAAPQPAVPLPTAPAKLSRRQRRERARAAAARPQANRLPVQTRPAAPPPPPPWATPQQPQRPLPPPRRKRRGRRLFLFATLGVLCCCGLPFAYFQFPAARQYPVSAVLPTDFSDLSLRDDNASKRAADRLAQALKAADSKDGKPFAGVYGDSRGKRVTIFGVTGWRFTPKSDVRAQLNRLADDFGLTGVQSFDLGEAGAYESCGVGRANGAAVVVCAWADHGSMATVLLTRRRIDESADLVGRLRSAVLTPG
ncbi:hypothetical protein ODJ79_43170 [Actinoplanes sp. KI2]|uniref:hypothetical protein n=1 Tax=Actinoplanes sp. KI2 TaxID=2983315 RepID=UPI0021D58E74|nr:hypothetical protein [Actinoplanes sp. KI2]MCU7730559.1 hypothetical protein [Actinoplanes sp. KI2]